MNMNKISIHYLIARISIAFIFLTFGIWEIIQPAYWTAYLPGFAFNLGFISPDSLLMVHGAVLILLALGLLFLSRYLRIFASLSALVMLSIVASLIMSTGWDDVLVRDITILLFTISLIF